MPLIQNRNKVEKNYLASYEYMDKLDKVKACSESNTPARAILEWLDNGGDE
jgi:hypothetical protein